jgi:hypothetical protein
VKVLVKARMRNGNAWSDVCLVNLSSRGAGLQCATPPSAGSYVEIKRGSNVVIVARWPGATATVSAFARRT